ncbi:MAG: 2-oxoacid:acceptor oxidoreductase subunit alpha [Chloroflexi bacterium]|nr:2-oxoacid:acceptor oxidoreductase subunit alpha [Chloroflexota bacterium]
MAGEITLTVGGQAGQGVQSIGLTLARAFARGGLHVFAQQDYESRVRGGHNSFKLRMGPRPVMAALQETNILVALDPLSLDVHMAQLTDPGVAIFDGEKTQVAGPRRGYFPVPLERLAQESGGNRLMQNSVAAGAAAGLTGFDFSIISDAVAEQFKGRGPEVEEGNRRAAQAGYDYALTQFGGRCDCSLSTMAAPKRLLLDGNEALVLGALAGGCRFMAGYPMTPSTPILQYMATKGAGLGAVGIQTEDEIAAINMAIGASFAGVRAMTATAGGGFSLMVEGLGLAGMTETPVVIVVGQRPGPATGFPTRTEQGDLEFVLHAAQGEFARIVLTPGTPEQAFALGFRAFNLAERYQLPVIILTDQQLADSYRTIEPFDLSSLQIDRGELLLDAPPDYMRYRLTPSGISPRAVPGLSSAVVVADSDEHAEDGHITEDGAVRTAMVRKRVGKLELARADIVPPEHYGEQHPELLLIGWGSTYGALREAVDDLRADGVSAGMLHLSQVWPFPNEQVQAAMKAAKKSVMVENNASGQLARVMRGETGLAPDGHILKYDGRPFSPSEITTQARRWLR